MVDADDGGSSYLNVVSGRELRSRKRSAADDIIEESDGSSSNDDEVEDETYRVEHRAGKGPVQLRKEERMMMRQVVMHLSLPSQDIPLVVHRQTILGMA